MTHVLASVPADVPVVIAATIGPLRRDRATAPLIERFVGTPEIAAASAWLPACARALADRTEWIVVGFADVMAAEPSFAIAHGQWTRDQAAECASDDDRIKIIGDHTIELRESSRRTSRALLPADLVPHGTTLRVRVSMMLDRLAVDAVFAATDEQTAVAIETRLRTQLAPMLAQPTLGMGALVLYHAGSRVTVRLDAGPTMLGVIESTLP